MLASKPPSAWLRCNPEVYELIRSVIMQEMLHMIQSANILIALNGSPVIDSKYVLPGHVLPGLNVTLKSCPMELCPLLSIIAAKQLPSFSN